MAQVNRFLVDLSVVNNRKEVVPRGATITDVYVGELAAGVPGVELIFGQDSPNGFLNIFQGQSFECCPPESDGLYVTSPIIGGTLILNVTIQKSTGGAAARGS